MLARWDGIADDKDYELWKASFGSTGEFQADGNSDGIADAADYTIWRNNSGPGSVSLASVPEPSAA